MTEASTSHPATTNASVNPTPGVAPQQSAATSPDQQPSTEPPVEEHKKHGIGALVDKIVHPHGHSHSHSKDGTPGHADDAPSVPVAVPTAPSDGVGPGPVHLAPGGSGVGGIM